MQCHCSKQFHVHKLSLVAFERAIDACWIYPNGIRHTAPFPIESATCAFEDDTTAREVNYLQLHGVRTQVGWERFVSSHFRLYFDCMFEGVQKSSKMFYFHYAVDLFETMPRHCPRTCLAGGLHGACTWPWCMHGAVCTFMIMSNGHEWCLNYFTNAGPVHKSWTGSQRRPSRNTVFEPVQSSHNSVNHFKHHHGQLNCAWTGSKTVNRFKTPAEPVHPESLFGV